MTTTLPAVTQPLHAHGPSRVRRWWDIPRPAWFDYATILLLQLKRIWGLWKWREMAGGDTCSYFLSAYSWFRKGHANFGYSPLYCSFWGEILHVTDDVAAAWMLHRVLIILATAVLVLAFMRRVLPRDVAWLAAAWWALLPINFDTIYEVHLFAVIPIVLTWVAILSAREASASASWRRGIAIALMIISTFLVRNEMVVSLGCLCLVCLAWEVHLHRKAAARQPAPKRILVSYLVPVLISLGMVFFYYQRSDFRGKRLRQEMHDKHIVSMGQMHALGYADRNPDWNKSPWSDFEDANLRDFKMPHPTLADMLRRNPVAVIRHCWWNVRLLPGSLQLLLFEQMSGQVNPDVEPQETGSRYALLLSFLAGIVVVAAAVKKYLQRRGAVRAGWSDSAFAWAAIVAVVGFSAPVILLLRPRPDYLFSLSLLAMALLGVSLVVLIGSWRVWRGLSPVMPVCMVGVVIWFPSYFNATNPPGGRPLTDNYYRLRPFAGEFARVDATYAGVNPVELQNYLGLGRCQIRDMTTVAQREPGQTIAAALEHERINLFYLDAGIANLLEVAAPGAVSDFLNRSDRAGWLVLANEQERNGNWWVLLRRKRPSDAFAGSVHPIRFAGSSLFAGWLAVSGFQPIEGPYPAQNLPVVRWGLFPESRLSPVDTSGGQFRLNLSGLAPIGGQRLTVLVDGNLAASRDMPPGVFTDLSIPMELTPGKHEIAFRYSTFQIPDPIHNPGLRQSILFKEIRLTRQSGDANGDADLHN